MNWLRVAKARYVTRKSFILFFLFTICSLSVLIGQSSKIRQLKNLVVNRRGLKAAPTVDLDEENTQYYAYIPVPRKTEEFFASLKESTLNTAIRDTLLRCFSGSEFFECIRWLLATNWTNC